MKCVLKWLLVWGIFAIARSCAAAQETRPVEATARLWIERALHAENEEHDLAKALACYRSAIAAAAKAADPVALDQANAGEARVMVRTGKTQDAPAAPVNVDAPVCSLVYRLAAAAKDDVAAIQNDLVLYGNAALGILDVALGAGYAQLDSNGATAPRAIDKRRVAEVIANIKSPEAAAILGRHLGASDPVEQTAVAEALDADVSTQAVLLRRALASPASAVRAIAARSLFRTPDPTLEPAMYGVACEGVAAAAQWLVRYAPERIADLVANDAVPVNFRVEAAGLLPREGGGAMPERVILGLLKLTESIDDMSVMRRAFSTLEIVVYAPLKGKPDATNPVAPRFSKTTMAAIEDRGVALLEKPGLDSGVQTVILRVLGGAGGMKTLRFLERLPASASDIKIPVNSFEFGAVIAARLDDAQFADVIELVRAKKSGSATAIGDEILIGALRQLAQRNSIPAERWMAEFRDLSEKDATTYANLAVANIYWRALSPNAAEGDLAAARRVLPLARRVALKGDGQNQKLALNGIVALKDKESLPLVFDLVKGARTSDPQFIEPLHSLAHLFPDETAALYEKALEAAEADEGSAENGLMLQRIWWLPETKALETFQTLYAKARKPGTKNDLVWGLCQNAPAGAATALLVEHYGDLPPGGRVTALARFARELTTAAMPILGEALKDADENVRAKAREAFAEFKKHREALAEFEAWTQSDAATKKTSDELIALLTNGSEDVKIGAALALGAMRKKETLPALAKAMDGASEKVKAAIVSAMEKIATPIPAAPAPAPKSGS